jgi:hypothetical protein
MSGRYLSYQVCTKVIQNTIHHIVIRFSSSSFITYVFFLLYLLMKRFSTKALSLLLQLFTHYRENLKMRIDLHCFSYYSHMFRNIFSHNQIPVQD